MNIAILGCYRRFNAYMETLPKLSADINVMYVCDVDQVRLSDAKAKVTELMGYAPNAEGDLRKVLDDKKVEAVMVSLPDHWHAPATFMAVKAGKHVYLEKP